MIISPLLSNVRHRAMITPVSPMLTRFIHISPSSGTSYRSFEIILDVGTFHWIGLQIQCSVPGFSICGPWPTSVMGMIKFNIRLKPNSFFSVGNK